MNIVGKPPQQARQQQGQLIWKIQKERLTITIVGWHFSQLVYGAGPAHQRVEKHQLTWKGVKEKINN